MTLDALFARFLAKHPHVATSHLAARPKAKPKNPYATRPDGSLIRHDTPNRAARRAELRRLGVAWSDFQRYSRTQAAR